MAELETIFRKYDIRGVYGEDLTDQAAERIGRAFGAYIRERGVDKAVVGMDNRTSSPRLKAAVIKGICSAGADVVDIGTVITPIFYYSTIRMGIPAGIMVTASHNPAEYNGFKVQFGERTLYGPELQEIRKLALKGSPRHGTGRCEQRPVADAYIGMIADKVRLGQRKLKVVVDAGNGTAGLFAPAVFERLGCEVIPLYCDSDPAFPHHFPDPTRVDNMQDLIRSVKGHNADLGLGFDGDGDRLGVVDETGEIIWGDKLMVLFWREILPRYPGTDAIVEVKCSDLLVDEIRKLGGKPVFYKTGHSLIKAKMKEMNAVFTGEMSGHMFFADEYYGYDDAVYAAARLLRILSNSDRTLHELLADLPQSYASPEIRVPCPEQEKAFYVKKARRELGRIASGIVDVDGVRARFEDGWGLVRASNTGPELIVRYEGRSMEAGHRIKQEIERALYPLKIA
jgi:phosphomannomutase/phosphoglucomutase